MAETANLMLPFLAAGQAQKHLTVNDAFERLDVLLMLAARSRTLVAPPSEPAEGERFIVPSGASADWAGEDGRIAAFLNGGWRFFAPKPGWRCFVEDEAIDVVYASGVWAASSAPGAVSGSIQTLEFEHAIAPGGAHFSAGTVPAGALVFGVTARVLETVTGVSGWSLGVEGAPTRYGEALPVSVGAAETSARGAPQAYIAGSPILLTPEGGSFGGGRVKLALHYMTLAAPSL